MAKNGIHNADVRAIVNGRPSIDRYAQTLQGPMEWVVSVHYESSAVGYMEMKVSMDMVNQADRLAARFTIGSYPIHEHEEAKGDALVISDKYGITCRCQNLATGWYELSVGYTPPLHPDNWRGF